MLKLLHYDLILHIASLVVTFLVKVTFCAINFVSSPSPHPLPADYNDQSNIVFFVFTLGLAGLNVELFMWRTKLSELSCHEKFDVWLS